MTFLILWAATAVLALALARVATRPLGRRMSGLDRARFHVVRLDRGGV